MGKITEEFTNHINSGVEAKSLEAKFLTKTDAINHLTHRINAKGITKKYIVNKITPGDSNGYKYLNGNRKMKRDLLLKICIACSFTPEETNSTLKQFEFIELYPRVKRDYIVLRGITENKNIDEINERLAKGEELKL